MQVAQIVYQILCILSRCLTIDSHCFLLPFVQALKCLPQQRLIYVMHYVVKYKIWVCCCLCCYVLKLR